MGIRGAPERTVCANELAIKALKPGEDRYIAWVEGHPKLGVRVTPKGARAWVYAYRFGGKLRWLTLGPCPTLPLKEARAAWSEAAAKLARGEDPGAAKAEVKEPAGITVAALIEE